MSTLRKCLDETRRDDYTHILTMALCVRGIDIMGLFPLGKKQLKFLIVAIDYFKKWVEAEPVTTITKAKITSLVWKNIICRFRVPCVIISDNGKQFATPSFENFTKT